MPKILVIDDDAADRSAMGEDLGAQGHEITLVDSGSAALKLIQGGALFDLVVTDIVMPEMDGLEVVGAIRRHAPEWRILAVTNALRWSNFDIRTVATELGADETIYKPYAVDDLLGTVSSLLNRRAA